MKQSQGFTLLELLIVIGLLGILALSLVTILNPLAQIQKANDSRRKADLAELQKALELYYQDNQSYPPSTADFKIGGASAVDWGTAWNPYIAKVPADPTSTKHYVYYSPPTSNGQTYYLYTSLDRPDDPQLCDKTNACSGAIAGPGGQACGGTCNFGLTSPNVTP